VISGELPAAARLQFFQALRRKENLRQMATALTRRFAMIAFGIGATPIPVGDVFLLAPLQMLLVAVIAGLSCRRPTLAVAKEYAAAAPLYAPSNLLPGRAFRYPARQRRHQSSQPQDRPSDGREQDSPQIIRRRCQDEAGEEEGNADGDARAKGGRQAEEEVPQ